MLGPVPPSARLQFAALMVSSAETRADAFAIAIDAAPPVSANPIHTMLMQLDAATRMQLGGLLMAPDSARQRLAAMLCASISQPATSTVDPIRAMTLRHDATPLAASNPVPARPRGRLDAAQLEAALRSVAGVALGAPTMKQVYLQFRIEGALSPVHAGRDPNGNAPAQPSDDVMVSLVQEALGVMLPRFRTYLEAQWAALHPGTRWEVMSFRVRCSPHNPQELLLHVVAMTDPARLGSPLDTAVLHFAGHLLRQLREGVGCVDTIPLHTHIVTLCSAAIPTSIRTANMGELDMYSGEDAT